MDLRERYIKNVNRFGSSQGERDKLKLEMAFEKLLNDSTNSVEIEYTTIANIIAENEPNTEKVVINDSRINDKTFFDEKLIFCKNTSNITVGITHDSSLIVGIISPIEYSHSLLTVIFRRC